MDQDLDRRIRRHTRFDITDIFGKGRIRKLMYEYDNLKWTYQKEVEHDSEIINGQAAAVTAVVEKLTAAEKEIEYLKAYIRESDSAKQNMQKNRMDAERRVSKLADENDELKTELAKLNAEHHDLINLHEKLLELIKKERPDIDLDSIGRAS